MFKAPDAPAFRGLGRAVHVTPRFRPSEPDRDLPHRKRRQPPDQRIGQGRENARQYLRDHPDVADKIEKIVREEALAAMEAKGAAEAPSATPEEEDPDLALMDEVEE